MSPPPALTDGAGRTGSGCRLPAVAAAIAAAATWGVAAAVGLSPLLHAAQWLVVGLVGMPVLFALSLGVAVGLLSGLMAALALPAWLRRRPTGLGALLAALWALPAGILPGYWRALRRVRHPWLWGAVAGFLSGVVLFASIRGLRPGL